MNLTELLTIIISFVTGGGLLFILTIRVQREKIKAEYEKLLSESKSNELENVEKAISIWRESAEQQTKRVQHLENEIVKLQGEITSLKKFLKTKK